MAGRKDKNTVDYFPHYCVAGKTRYILESKFGNDGYAVLFKTFELLGSSENHYYDFRTIEHQEFVSALTKIQVPELIKIYDLLSNLGTIHGELWGHKILYSPKFVENVQDAYKRRSNLCMQFSNLCIHLSLKCIHKYDVWGNSVDINTQSKVKESKEKKRKGKEMHLFINSPYFEKDFFVSEFLANKDYEIFNAEYYYEAVKNWSGEGNKTKANWLLTARNWAMRDLKENKAKLKNTTNGGNKITTITNTARIGTDGYAERQNAFFEKLLTD